MSFQALARTWRPRRFDQLAGQEHVVRALTHALDNDKLHHALLFSGTRGVGKTTLGRIIAKCLNCEHGVSATPCVGEDACTTCREIDEGRYVDLIEVDAASRTGVDDTRELMDNVQYAPTRGRTKVYLIDEVHMLTKHSFNALLKTLEEPPPRVQFLLATTEPEKIPVTILSRCLQFPLKRLSAARIQARLAHIVAAESLEADDAALVELARAADGSMRDGLSLLDQAVAFGGGHLAVDNVRDMLGTIGEARVAELVDAVIDLQATQALAALEALYAQGIDMRYLLDAMATAWQHIATIQVVGEPIDDESERWQASAQRISPALTQLYYDITIAGSRDHGFAPDPLTAVRMCVLRMLAFAPRDNTPSPSPSPAQGGQPSRSDTTAPAPKTRPSSSTTGSTNAVPADPPANAPRLSAREAMARARAQLAGKAAPDTSPADKVSDEGHARERSASTDRAPEMDALPDEARHTDPSVEDEACATERQEASADSESSPQESFIEPPEAVDDQPPIDISAEPRRPSSAREDATDRSDENDSAALQSDNGSALAVDDAAQADPVDSSASTRVSERTPAPIPGKPPVELASEAVAMPTTPSPADEMPAAASANPDHPEDWHQIVPKLSLKGFALQLANNARCRHLDNDVVELEIARAYQMLVTDESKASIQQALADTPEAGGGPRLQVHLVDVLDDTPAQRHEADAERRQQDAVASIENDPIIRELRDQLGAQLRFDTIKPHRRKTAIQQRDEP